MAPPSPIPIAISSDVEMSAAHREITRSQRKAEELENSVEALKLRAAAADAAAKVSATTAASAVVNYRAIAGFLFAVCLGLATWALEINDKAKGNEKDIAALQHRMDDLAGEKIRAP